MNEPLKVRRIGERGPVVALVHGWGWDGRVLLPLAGALASRTRVVLPDLPGYGLNRDHSCADFDACVDQLADAVPDADALVGWSLGGLLAMAWAGRRRVRRLLLVGATPCFMERPDWVHGMSVERFAAFANELADDPARARRRFAALSALGDAEARAVRAGLGGLIDDQPPRAQALSDSVGWLQRRDQRADLRALAQPVLWLHGCEDRVIDIQAAREAADGRGDPLLAVAGAGHLPWRGDALAEACAWVAA